MHPNTVSMPTPAARLVALVLLALAVGPWASASAAPLFPKGDTAKGQALHQQKCASCHNSMMPDGKGEELYSEDFRKMKSASELRTMVEFCANRSRAGWFEEEIEHASRFLNDRFYQFKR
jgi:mono/diheme cytochrome c family protein